MTVKEILQELTQPDQRRKHFHRFTNAIGVLIIDTVVFLATIFIGTLLLGISWNALCTTIALAGGLGLWVWMQTGGKVE